LSAYRLHAESKTVSDFHALKNNEECLKTVMKYYEWAPVNRIFGFFYYSVKGRLPEYLQRIRPLVIFIAAFFTFFKYILLNRGIKMDDIKMITPGKIRQIFSGWEIGKNI
jgi:hypothetical protein